ncbi:MAG: hypothetical protein BGO70_16590 [Bacteroidetes bacterium 43-93]|nr:hypothetical protein [Bacteroidota bacterium]OJX01381.1 MAG: hypothetical protein BGO70_16590 [Bacteroidetes bacterium 43-93]
MQTSVIEALKKGSFFKMPGKKPVYIKDDYNRTLKKYSAYKFDDVNAYRHLKKGTIVEIGFDF